MSKTLGQRLEDLNIEVGTAITIDWNQVRIQAAIAAMQGMIISDVYADIEISNQMTYEKSRKKWDNIKIAKAAVAHADALVAELKKGGGKNEND